MPRIIHLAQGEPMSAFKNWGYHIAPAAAFAIVSALILTQPSKAADLGGNCCSELEERIAELEATTARKGNRKVSITISGQISEAVVGFGTDDVVATGSGIFSGLSNVLAKGMNHWQVQSNSNRDAQSYLQVAGVAQIQPGLKGGFILQLGTGGFENGLVWSGANGSDSNQVYVRESYVYLKSDQFGSAIVGKAETATWDITGATASNTGIAHTKLSLAPIMGPSPAMPLDLFDGGIADVVKYKSPELYGFHVETSWASADKWSNASGWSANGNMWDAALKYNKEIEQFLLDGRVGYRDGHVVEAFGFGNVQDIKVWAGSLGAKHLPTGAFANASYGNLDYSHFCPGAVISCDNAQGWEVQAGDEARLSKAGRTTGFVNYGETKVGVSQVGGSATADLKVQSYGAGVIQHIDGAAMDFYADWTHYNVDLDLAFKGGGINVGTGADVYMVGALIQF